ncbi:MAG TPA: hypothetical protein VLG92_00405 [Candidatus Saccharimonadia bacterium]|nr:hypothetical protein [Candidatus Saccharimonadia bacterium]
MISQKLDTFHKTRAGAVVFGLIELAMTYGFINWALDSGGWWLWVIALFLFVGSLQNLGHTIWRTK